MERNSIILQKKAITITVNYHVLRPSEDTKILDFNQYQKCDKALFIIYAGLECLKKRLMDVNIILKIHPQQR